MKVAHGVEMLEISGVIFGQAYRIYPILLLDEETTLLVDTGYPGHHAQIRDAIEKVDVPFRNLNKVLLTHQDVDHLGGLSAILKELPDQVKVLAHEQEKAYIQGSQHPHKLAQLEDHLDEKPEEMRVFYEQLKLAYRDCFVQVDQTLVDREELPYLGGVVAIHTPGHTIGHICLYLKTSKILIAGDILLVEAGRLVPCPIWLNCDMKLYQQSLQKLTTYDIQTVICYHGGLYQDQPYRRIVALANDEDGNK